MALKAVAGRVSYAALFCLVLPGLLAWWAIATGETVSLPAYGNQALGALLALAGGGLILWAFAALWWQGGGLPMNAFPPPRFVSAGPYRLLPHPIYGGFTMACAGISMAAGSASGLWLVSPAVALGCGALVLGYEAEDLKGRLKGRQCAWLPESSAGRPELSDHARFFLFVLLPWIALYEIVVSPGVPADGIAPVFPFEQRLPIWSWTEAIYSSPYIVVPLASFLAAGRRSLRLLMIRAWLAMAIAFPLYLALPVVAPRRPFVPSGFLGWLLAWERATDPPVAAFPSFHVIWAILVAETIAERMPRFRVIARAWAVAVAASCITTGMHTIVDVAAGAAFGLLLIRADRVWFRMRSITERIANSWREWRIGPVRIINHGIYAGAAAFSAVAIVGVLTGPANRTATSLAALAAIVGAGLWAQWVEGSPRLLRPFGFYGGFFGIAAAAALGPVLGWDTWLLGAAYCVASPLMQSLGRLRCLVQGCCHGRPADPAVGIRYTHPRSRVTRIAHLEGVPVHATPLYSILWNGLAGLVMARLWSCGTPLHMIVGIFAILTGIGRFVEEGYRGEPQTPVFAGLRLYQWIALGTVVGGALVTAMGRSDGAPRPVLYREALAPAVVFGLIAAAALGVDFPGSNRRFARLA